MVLNERSKIKMTGKRIKINMHFQNVMDFDESQKKAFDDDVKETIKTLLYRQGLGYDQMSFTSEILNPEQISSESS